MKIKKLLIHLLILGLLLPSLCAAESAYDPDTDPVLNVITERARYFHENHLGYPLNEDIQLDGFYEWFEKNGIGHAMLNNAGDPNHVGANHGALEVEQEVIRFFAPYYGFDPDHVWGLVSSSGTDGNNHGIYFGRHYLTDITGTAPVLYVSTESHYSNMRLAELQQMEVRLIPTDEMGRMIPEEFRAALDPKRPVLVVLSMGTTFKGGIDDIRAINAILAEVNPPAVYRHVDAALFGGYLPFTEYADLVNRNVYEYDSIAVSGHKFFGIDEPCGLFFVSPEVMEHQDPYEISYLNGSMPMINCSRSALNPLKFYWIIKTVGAEGLRKQSESILKNTAYLKKKMDEIGWPAWVSSDSSNTVFFKKPSDAVMDRYFLAPDYDDRFGGDLAHVVVMQNSTPKLLDRFVEDLKAELQPSVGAPAADRDLIALRAGDAKVTAGELEAAVQLHMFRAALQCAGYGYEYDIVDPLNIEDAMDKEVFEIERKILIRKLAEQEGIWPLDAEAAQAAEEAARTEWDAAVQIAMSMNGLAFLPAGEYEFVEGDDAGNLTRYFKSFGLTEDVLLEEARIYEADELLRAKVMAARTDLSEDDLVIEYANWFMDRFEEMDISEDAYVISLVMNWLGADVPADAQYAEAGT